MANANPSTPGKSLEKAEPEVEAKVVPLADAQVGDVIETTGGKAVVVAVRGDIKSTRVL